MRGWKKVKLGDCIEIIGGGTPKTKKPDYWNGSIPWLSVVDFNSDNKYVSDTEKKITQLGLENSSTKLLQKGDIIISARGTIGALAILKKEMAFNQSCYGIRARENISTNDFIYYSLKNTVSRLKQISHGAVFDTITRNTFNEITINLPPLFEQKAIAEVLSSLDDKIDLLHRQNKTLEQMAETLFRQWFIEERDESWEEVVLGAAIQPKKGKNITKTDAIDGPYPVIAGGLSPSCFHIKSNTLAPVITISASGANAGYVQLNHTPVWSSDSSYIDNNITRYVYFYYVFLKINQGLIFDKQEGSAQPHIYPRHLMELDILDYPQKRIINFESICSDFFSKIKTNKENINILEKLRDTLLPKLMSGDVRVKI